MTKTRTETDTFGPIEVDASRYWGAQAQRSLGNFKIGWEKQPAAVVRALGIVKQAAAQTNMALGGLDKVIGETIVKAAQDGSFKGGNITGAVGLAPYHDLDSKVPADVKTKMTQVTADVVSGKTPTGFDKPSANCPQG